MSTETSVGPDISLVWQESIQIERAASPSRQRSTMTDLLGSLFPRPRVATITTGEGPSRGAAPRTSLDDTLPAEGFRLRADASGIEVRYADARGLRYALATLDQLRAHPDFTTSVVDIEDHPDFAVRGYMLDVSRDRVPTRATLLRYLDLAERARLNHFELYIEHTFAYEGHDLVWQDASPFTVADLRWFDAECVARGIDFVPSVNCLGHMERWLKHPAYKDRSETPDGYVWGFENRAAATLEPTRENADFTLGLLLEIAETTSSGKINIGADEPFELGQGASADAVAERGRGEVYFEYVRHLLERLTERGYQVEFWADIFAEHPELMGRVPQGAVPVVWQYDGPVLSAAVIDGADDELRAKWEAIAFDVEATRQGARGRAAALIESGEPFWLAPGTSTWQSFVGRTDNAVDNLVDVARTGLDTGARGYVNTQWGDHGSLEPPVVSFGPLLLGGAVSWCLDSNADLDLATLVDTVALLDRTGRIGRATVEAGGAAHALGSPLLNASQLFTVLWRAGEIPPGSWPTPSGVAAARAKLETARALLVGAEPEAADGELAVSELDHAIRFALLAADVLDLGHGALAELDPETALRLRDRLDVLLAEQRTLWLRRSRPGGLDDAVGKLVPLRRLLERRAVLA
ncbi:glycoside hydrolase [Labedella populi]|uniref:beta-N-acetylhexosaminidase n=1 Tax=Labedella populi TaxID=2498850 RepID=A0A444QCJ9_9MICO|nr:glycoside hydrolase family 20 zincin-like fold domain-containing protein [Labedella populi]RWZ64430.1 glycoside hydrolase [Labedella populi]